MKKIMVIATALVFVCVLFMPAMAAPKAKQKPKAEPTKESVLVTDGVLVKVDKKKGEIYLKKGDKKIKFNAGIEVVKESSKKIKSKVVVKYIIRPDGAMLIKEISYIKK